MTHEGAAIICALTTTRWPLGLTLSGSRSRALFRALGPSGFRLSTSRLPLEADGGVGYAEHPLALDHVVEVD